MGERKERVKRLVNPVCGFCLVREVPHSIMEEEEEEEEDGEGALNPFLSSPSANRRLGLFFQQIFSPRKRIWKLVALFSWKKNKWSECPATEVPFFLVTNQGASHFETALSSGLPK